MSATYKLKYRRWVKRGASDLMSVTGMSAMTTLAYARMASANWVPVEEQASDLPLHKWDQTGFKDTYDASKYCGNYENGKQIAYATAACYSIKIPAEARSGTTAKVEAVLASVYGDRWLSEGAIVSSFLSSSESPPLWSEVINTASPTYIGSTLDPAPLPNAVTSPDWKAPLRRVIRSNGGADSRYSATVASVVPTNSDRYLHVIIRLSDYISVSKIAIAGGGFKDNAWIEGGAAIEGTTLSVQFDREVVADANTIVFANEFTVADTCEGSRFDASTETVNLTHSAGIFYSDTVPPTTHKGDLVMMRRILAMRNVDSKSPRSVSASGDYLGFGVSDNFDFIRGKIGVEYEKEGTLDVYKLFGVTVMRGSETDGGFASGISFNTKVNALPVGQLVRFSFYGKSGMLPYVNLNGALIPQYSTYPHSITDDFVLGKASKFFLNVGVGGGFLASGAIDPSLTPFSEIEIKPLGHYDITNASIEAGTVLPFSAPWQLPRHAVVIVTANVINYTSDWVPADKTSTAIIWEPNDITLHLT